MQTKLSLVQIKICHPLGSMPLLEPILVYYKLEPKDINVSEIWIKSLQVS